MVSSSELESSSGSPSDVTVTGTAVRTRQVFPSNEEIEAPDQRLEAMIGRWRFETGKIFQDNDGYGGNMDGEAEFSEEKTMELLLTGKL